MSQETIPIGEERQYGPAECAGPPRVFTIVERLLLEACAMGTLRVIECDKDGCVVRAEFADTGINYLDRSAPAEAATDVATEPDDQE